MHLKIIIQNDSDDELPDIGVSITQSSTRTEKNSDKDEFGYNLDDPELITQQREIEIHIKRNSTFAKKPPLSTSSSMMSIKTSSSVAASQAQSKPETRPPKRITSST